SDDFGAIGVSRVWPLFDSLGEYSGDHGKPGLLISERPRDEPPGAAFFRPKEAHHQAVDSTVASLSGFPPLLGWLGPVPPSLQTGPRGAGPPVPLGAVMERRLNDET